MYVHVIYLFLDQTQCHIKGNARGAVAPGPAVFWGRGGGNWWEWTHLYALHTTEIW